MNAFERSRQLIEQLIPRLEAEGYTVYLHPLPEFLPTFMKDYVPDAIALGPPDGSKKNLAINMIVDGSVSKPRTKTHDLKRLFAGQNEWESRVYYAPSTNRQDILPPTTEPAAAASIREVEQLIAEGRSGAALLVAWATLEALGRLLLPKKLGRPQTPETLLDVLAGDGYITPSEADVLRSLKQARNQLVHGMLEQTVSSAELAKFIEVLKLLLTFVKQPAPRSGSGAGRQPGLRSRNGRRQA